MDTAVFDLSTIEFDKDGHIANRADWNKDVAQQLAYRAEVGDLNDRHWVVIDYIRAEFEKNDDAPSIRKLTKESGINTKELYALFPKGPAKKAALIAGLPKPKGCI
jgi:TusE/DsrC/DsvC family sulfur relay protein